MKKSVTTHKATECKVSIKKTLVCFVFINQESAIYLCQNLYKKEQESPAIADKPARRESMPKIAPIRRAYNVVADITSLTSFV